MPAGGEASGGGSKDTGGGPFGDEASGGGLKDTGGGLFGGEAGVAAGGFAAGGDGLGGGGTTTGAGRGGLGGEGVPVTITGFEQLLGSLQPGDDGGREGCRQCTPRGATVVLQGPGFCRGN